MAIRLVGAVNHYVGLSTDDRTVLVDVPVNSRLELETGEELRYDGRIWVLTRNAIDQTSRIVNKLDEVVHELRKHTDGFQELVERELSPIT